MDDSKIIDLYWKRDETAVEMTQETYGERLRRLAFQILKSREDAQECENDTYFKAWNSIPPQKPQYFFAYLAKICRRAAFGKLDWANAKKRKAEIVELTAEMELCIPDTRAVSPQGEEIGRLLNEFLAELAEDSRIIFVRRYWFADSVAAISERYSMGESKVKTSLHRTRNKLKKYLESEGIML